MTSINNKINLNDNRTNSFKFNFNDDRSSSKIIGTQSRFNNHLLLKDNASSERVYVRRGSTESSRTLKIKKDKKKFSWAKVQKAIKKTFHPGSSSKKKYTKNENIISTDSIIISSAVYEDEKNVKSHKGKEEKNENSKKENKKSHKVEEKDKEKENTIEKSSKSEENINQQDQNDNTEASTSTKLNTSNNESSINNDKPEQVQHKKSNSDDKAENKVENNEEYKEEKHKNASGYPSNLQHKHNIPNRSHVAHALGDELNHEFRYGKDVSGEFLKNICESYYRYESDESSESTYSDLDSVKGITTNNLRENHYKELSMNYPSVSNKNIIDQEEVDDSNQTKNQSNNNNYNNINNEIEKNDSCNNSLQAQMEKGKNEVEGNENAYPEDSKRITDELSHLHCIIEGKADSNSNIRKVQNNNSYSTKDDSDDNSINNGSNEISSFKNYKQNNVSVPDIFNIRSKSKESNYRGHGKTNSYSFNDPNIFKSNTNGNSNMHTSLSTYSAFSGSNSFSGNLFGTIRSDTNDKYNKYHSLRTESRSNSIIKIRNSSRDNFLNFKKNEPRSRIDKSLNGNISKRSKKTLNTIHFKANYFNEKSRSYSNGGEENASNVDISSGLSAKVFADLVGINILYDNDEKEDNAYLQKQGLMAKPSDTHNITDFSMFVPPSSTEMAALRTPTFTEPVNVEELKEQAKENNIINTSHETNKVSNVPSSVTVTAASTETTQSDNNNIIHFKHHTKDLLNKDMSNLSSNSVNIETPNDDNNNEGKPVSPEIISTNHTFTITTNGTSIIKNPSSTPRTLSYDKERNTITQSTVSATGRTFEVSFSSNTEFLDKSKPITTQTHNIINQVGKIKNSKTEPNIHNIDSPKTLSRNSSCSSNKLMNNNSKSNANVRNTSGVSLVDGGPTEEMCRSILEKANTAIKIDLEFSRLSDGFTSGIPTESISNDSTFESTRTGEIQTNPLNHKSLKYTNESNGQSRQDSSMESSGLNGSTNRKVITYNRPLLSNNGRVIFFKSKRNNYINLQSSNFDGNKHRQFHRRKSEININKSNNYDKPSVVEEVEEDIKDGDVGNEMKVSPSRRNSVFYSIGPTIKNLHTFSFTNRRSSQSSMSSSPNDTILNSTFDSTNGDVSGSNATGEATSTAHATEITKSSTLTPLMPSTLVTSETATSIEEIDSISNTNKSQTGNLLYDHHVIENSPIPVSNTTQPSSNFQLPETSNSLHPQINQNNQSNSEQKDSIHSLFDTPIFPILKSQVVSNSTPSTPRRTRTVITTSKDNNKTVVTTTKTTSNNHTFITTKTTSIKNGSIPRSALSVDSNNSVSASSFPITGVLPTSNIQSSNLVENELMDKNNNQSTMGSDTNSLYFNSSTNSTLASKQSNYCNDSLGGIGRLSFCSDNGNSFYKCGKNLSSYDVPNSSLTSVGKVKRFRAFSLSNPRCSNLYDSNYSCVSNSNLDISSLDKHETKGSSPVIRPLMISNHNSIKVSNGEVLLGLDSNANLNNCIPQNISNTDNYDLVSEQLNNTVSEVNHLNISDSLSINNNGNTFIIQPIVPKNLHKPHTSNTQIIINENDGNISISSKLTTEETKGRFQIEKSEDINTTIILPTKDNYEETKLINQKKISNGAKSEEIHDKNETQIPSPYSNSETLDKSGNLIDYKLNDSTLNKDYNEQDDHKLSGNENISFGTMEQCSIINNSISEKNISNNEYEVNPVNDPATINSASPTKKKEIVKGRFTITTDS